MKILNNEKMTFFEYNLLSRVVHEVEGTAYECRQVRIKIIIFENFFGAKNVKTEKVIMRLSKHYGVFNQKMNIVD